MGSQDGIHWMRLQRIVQLVVFLLCKVYKLKLLGAQPHLVMRLSKHLPKANIEEFTIDLLKEEYLYGMRPWQSHYLFLLQLIIHVLIR